MSLIGGNDGGWVWPSLTGRNHETMGEGVAKLHKGVAESHKRKPWGRGAETMREGCPSNI